MDKKWTTIPDDKTINDVANKLNENNIETFVVENGNDAKAKFFELLPKNSQVFTNTSTTLNTLGITDAINESDNFVSLKNKVSQMPSHTEEKAREKRMIGSVPEYAVGSAHAITKDGRVMMASGSGSQLPGYVYGADHVIWVISANKIVENIDEGIKRIYEHSLPLESARMDKVTNSNSGSNPRRILIFNSENDMNKNRTKLIIVKEVLGF